MVDLLLSPNTTGVSPVDPEITPAAVININKNAGHISIINPADESLSIIFSPDYIGDKVSVSCYDAIGRKVIQEDVDISSSNIQLPFNVLPGVYYVKVFNNTVLYETSVVKK